MRYDNRFYVKLIYLVLFFLHGERTKEISRESTGRVLVAPVQSVFVAIAITTKTSYSKKIPCSSTKSDRMTAVFFDPSAAGVTSAATATYPEYYYLYYNRAGQFLQQQQQQQQNAGYYQWMGFAAQQQQQQMQQAHQKAPLPQQLLQPQQPNFQGAVPVQQQQPPPLHQLNFQEVQRAQQHMQQEPQQQMFFQGHETQVPQMFSEVTCQQKQQQVLEAETAFHPDGTTSHDQNNNFFLKENTTGFSYNDVSSGGSNSSPTKSYTKVIAKGSLNNGSFKESSRRRNKMREVVPISSSSSRNTRQTSGRVFSSVSVRTILDGGRYLSSLSLSLTDALGQTVQVFGWAGFPCAEAVVKHFSTDGPRLTMDGARAVSAQRGDGDCLRVNTVFHLTPDVGFALARFSSDGRDHLVSTAALEAAQCRNNKGVWSSRPAGWLFAVLGAEFPNHLETEWIHAQWKAKKKKKCRHQKSNLE